MSRPAFRSTLQITATDPDAATAVSTSAADRLVLDLDDTVRAIHKDAAREAVTRLLSERDGSRRRLGIRVNAPSSPWAYEDILAVLRAGAGTVDFLCIPKVNSPSEVIGVEWLLGQLETVLGLDRQIPVQVQIETPSAVAHANAILAASRRCWSALFGRGDFSAGMELPLVGGEQDVPNATGGGFSTHVAMANLAVKARAAGVVPLDGPCGDVADFAATCEFVRSLGFGGVWCISEAQVEIANSVFQPREDELLLAQDALDREQGQAARDAAAPAPFDAAAILSAERTLAAAARADPGRNGAARRSPRTSQTGARNRDMDQ